MLFGSFWQVSKIHHVLVDGWFGDCTTLDGTQNPWNPWAGKPYEPGSFFFYEENDDEPADWGILC